jgi:tellurite methyltransferase
LDGGYDEGYRACPCFWGDQPGSLVAALLAERNVAGWNVLDLGCGEGKNAAALARANAYVTAIDCSELAISHGRQTFGDLPITWLIGDVASFPLQPNGYDLVVMYGLLHCLPSPGHISALINHACAATRRRGLHILVAFNDRDQDFDRAHPGFNPTLVPHKFYVDAYSGQRIVCATDTTLHEAHPHNKIVHRHSMTRLIAEI